MLRAIAIVFLTVIVATGAGAAPGGSERAAGRYCGSLFNGARNEAAITQFFVTASGQAFGSYRFEHDGEWLEGTLDPAEIDGERRATFFWHDKFGTGELTIQFSKSFSSFTGKWGSGDDEPSLSWVGSKSCKDTVS